LRFHAIAITLSRSSRVVHLWAAPRVRSPASSSRFVDTAERLFGLTRGGRVPVKRRNTLGVGFQHVRDLGPGIADCRHPDAGVEFDCQRAGEVHLPRHRAS
jgi:hypothetical protein